MTSINLTADELAQEIRRVDGDHSLGAGALADALLPFIRATLTPSTPAVSSEPTEGMVEAVAWRKERKTASDFSEVTEWQEVAEVWAEDGFVVTPLYETLSAASLVPTDGWRVLTDQGRDNDALRSAVDVLRTQQSQPHRSTEHALWEAIKDYVERAAPTPPKGE